MRKTMILLLTLGATGFAHAYDLTGTLGLNYTVGPAFLAGGSDARDAGQAVGPGVGASLEYGITRYASFQFGYDYLDTGLQAQAIAFSGIARFYPDKTTTPIAGVGLGFGKRYAGDDWDKFAMKLQGGIEHFLTADISVAGLFTYHFINSSDRLGSLHVFEPGLRMAYYFGHLR